MIISFNNVGTLTDLSMGSDDGHNFFEVNLPQVMTALAKSNVPFSYDPTHRQISVDSLHNVKAYQALEEDNLFEVVTTFA